MLQGGGLAIMFVRSAGMGCGSVSVLVVWVSAVIQEMQLRLINVHGG